MSNSIYKKYRHLRRIALNVWQANNAKRHYRYPQRGLRIIGVTGTDGKTTTSTMLAAILRESGKKVGVISTVGAKINDKEVDTGLHVSTPGPAQVYELLSHMKKEGVEDVVIEATSHGLDQRRLYGISFDIGIITNISPEHLDYHITMDEYIKAKSRLLLQSGMAILNADDPVVAKINQIQIPQLLFSAEQPTDIFASNISHNTTGSTFNLNFDNGNSSVKIKLSLPGRFNISNALAASSAALALQVPVQCLAPALSNISVPGRWQILQTSPYRVIIDFAHTPQSFEAILPTARELTDKDGRLIHVFGSAAQRDEQKRSLMGQISGKYADISIITMEDPRHESIDRIQTMLAKGLESSGKIKSKNYFRQDDRQQAINQAISLAKPGDVVIITGKGHEKSLAIKGQEIPWSDVDAVKQALQQFGEIHHEN